MEIHSKDDKIGEGIDNCFYCGSNFTTTYKTGCMYIIECHDCCHESIY